MIISLVAASVLLAGSALGATTTQTVIYQAFDGAGKPAIKVTKTVSGSCFTGSIAANRNDAWRCMSGNFLYDPCFSSPGASGIVLCPAAPWKASGIKIKLTKKLPSGNKRAPSTKGLPWGIQLFSGPRCTLIQGTSVIVQGKRANYGCDKGGKLLWGAPKRKTEPWKIFVAPSSAKALTKKGKIKIAWF